MSGQTQWNSEGRAASPTRVPSLEASATQSLLRDNMGAPQYASLDGSKRRGNLFSLVGLKNLFWQESVAPARAKTYYGMYLQLRAYFLFATSSSLVMSFTC
jgi:hypothetical protein